MNNVIAQVRNHLQDITANTNLYVTRITCAAIVAFTALTLVAPNVTYQSFGLIPGSVFSKLTVWSFVTAAFVHQSVLSSILNLIMFASLAPPVERAMGKTRFALFLLIANVSSFVAVFSLMIAGYALSASESLLFTVICGSTVLNAALTVAVKQRFSESSLATPFTSNQSIDSYLSLNYLPTFYIGLTFVMFIFGFTTFRNLLVAVFGAYCAWLYLRFYAYDADSSLTGDLRQEFAFASCFPEAFGIRGTINLAATIPFHALMRAGLFGDAIKAHNSSALNMNADLSSNVDFMRPTTALDAHAERRRLLAIKAIDEKLAQLANPNSSMHSSSSNQVLPDDSELERMERQLSSQLNRNIVEEKQPLLTESQSSSSNQSINSHSGGDSLP